MSVSRETALAGRAVLRLDDMERIRELHAYNAGLPELRRKMKLCRELRFGFSVMNPLLTLGILVARRESVFEQAVLAAVILACVIATYLFSLSRNAEPVHALASGLLMLLDWRCAILFAANIILAVLLVKTEKPLKERPGYPLFDNVEIVFQEPQ